MRKKVIVLGGCSGIGKSAAERFAREDWHVVVVSDDAIKNAQAILELSGTGHLSCCADVRSAEQVASLATFVQERLGIFHALVNCVGISRSHAAIESDFADWNECIQVMLYGTVRTMRALVPFVADGGRIVNITSIHHSRVMKGSSSYGMAKAAITQFSRSLALELAPRNILVNAVAPGFIDTPMSVKGDGKNELEGEWFKDNYIKYDHLPLRRPGKPDEVSGLIYFLAGSDASYITGSVITVDGGLTITF